MANEKPSRPVKMKPTWDRKSPEHADRQGSLVELQEPWEKDWDGMPEFDQKEMTPLKSVCVYFKTREDMEAFAKLIGQPLTMSTWGVWYPFQPEATMGDKRVVGADFEYDKDKFEEVKAESLDRDSGDAEVVEP